MYVCDTGNNCIRRVSSTGVVTTVAGLAGIAGSRDGTSTSALFNQPQALLVSNSIVVADTGNSVIRAINLLSVVSTVILKAPTTTTTTTTTGTSTGSSGYGGGGSMDPLFLAALLTLSGFALKRKRGMGRSEG